MSKKNSKKFPDIISTHLPKGIAYFRSHFWVDYVELLCLAHIDGQISQSEIKSHLRKLKDLSSEEDDSDEIEDLSEIEGNNEGHEGDVGTLEVDMIEPEKDDKWQKRVEDWFNHISNRITLCKDFYPFSTTSSGTVLKLSKLSAKKRLYISLLLCSALEYVREYSPKYSRTLDSCFELISLEALKNYMPKNATIRFFGKNKYNNTLYRKGSLWNKLNKLADELKEEVKAKKEDYSPNDNGDGNIDLIAWIPFEDSESAVLSLFAQCTCRTDWEDKQNETEFGVLRNIFKLNAQNTNAIFIPFYARKGNGYWQEDYKVRSILFDRSRILQNVKNVSFHEKLDSFTVVKEIITQKSRLI